MSLSESTDNKKDWDSTLDDEDLKKLNHKDLWNAIIGDFEEKRQAMEKNKKMSQEVCEQFVNPAVAYLEETIFPILNPGMVQMLKQVKEHDSFYKEKTYFNGVDYLSEYLYNCNPNHPERFQKWIQIFDTELAANVLKNKPRPFYPFSRLWSSETAAKKIQSYIRGYWVRIRPDVQEIRQFWKTLKAEALAEAEKDTCEK